MSQNYIGHLVMLQIIGGVLPLLGHSVAFIIHVHTELFFISVSPSTSIVSFRYVNSSILQAHFFLLVTSASATSSLCDSSRVFVRQQNNYATSSLPVVCNIRIQCKLYSQYHRTFTYMHYNANIQIQIQTLHHVFKKRSATFIVT